MPSTTWTSSAFDLWAGKVHYFMDYCVRGMLQLLFFQISLFVVSNRRIRFHAFRSDTQLTCSVEPHRATHLVGRIIVETRDHSAGELLDITNHSVAPLGPMAVLQGHDQVQWNLSCSRRRTKVRYYLSSDYF